MFCSRGLPVLSKFTLEQRGSPVTQFAVLAGWIREDLELLQVIKLKLSVICVKAQRLWPAFV